MKTLIDTRKDNAQILIEYANGGSFTIKVQDSKVEVKGRGVKEQFDNGNFEVTANKLSKLQALYDVHPNF